MEGEPSPEQKRSLHPDLDAKAIKNLIDAGLSTADATRYIEVLAEGRRGGLTEVQQKDKDRIFEAMRNLGVNPSLESEES